VFKARKRRAESAEADRGAVVAQDTSSSAPIEPRTEPPSEPARDPVDGTPTGAEQRTAPPVAEKELPRQRVEREDRQSGMKIVAGVKAVRSRIALLIWLIAVICALFLAIGALLVALRANRHNGVVSFVLDGADRLDLDVFGRKHGIFTFDGKDAAIKDALVNWGIGAIGYLVVGKLVDRVIRP
jgi:hypothetical protein